VSHDQSHLAPLDNPSFGPIGRSKNARLSTGYGATFPRKGGRAQRLRRCDIFAQRLAFAVQRVDVALDDIADRNDAYQPPVLHDGHVPEAAVWSSSP